MDNPNKELTKMPTENASKNALNEKSTIEEGLSKLQNTLTMLEKTDAENDIALRALHDQDKHDKSDKALKGKNKQNKEIDALEENKIIPARL